MKFEITRGRIIEIIGIVVFFVGFFGIDRLVGIVFGLPIIIYGESVSKGDMEAAALTQSPQ